ncbi:hypothetical protein CHL67_02550 [Prosthecochloris sp. GSB1]|nr:hypothetical protein CHL67_02550 [Prosthecochloris sp. GSB1]
MMNFNMADKWRVQVLRSWDEVDDPSFLEQWADWMRRSDDSHVFNHPLLVKTWTDTYRGIWNISPLYVLAEKNDVFVLFPLVLWRMNWKNAFIKKIIPAGYSDYDYHDPLVVGEVVDGELCSFWEAFCRVFLEEWKGVYDVFDLIGIVRPCKNMPWKEEEACPYIDMSRYENYEDYLTKSSKSLRGDIRRKTRMLEKYGTMSFNIYGQDSLDKALETLGIFLNVHRAKWPNAYKAPGFHENLLINTLPANLLHFSEVCINDVPVSWELNFIYKNILYYYMPVFSEEYAKCSPGRVHLSFLVEESFRNGVRVFDFMRGSEEYKRKWANAEAEVYRYGFNRNAFPSRAKFLLRNVMMYAKSG